jgi:hypothetical protein
MKAPLYGEYFQVYPWLVERTAGPSTAPPDFLWRLVALVNFMRLSPGKDAHAVLSSAAWQEIRACLGRDDNSYFGRCSVRFHGHEVIQGRDAITLHIRVDLIRNLGLTEVVAEKMNVLSIGSGDLQKEVGARQGLHIS